MNNKIATLSVTMIIQNEERHLASCLMKIQDIADEIVIVDSGSTDNSIAIAKQFGAKIYTNYNWQGFGVQRRLAQSYATGDYILALDADERVSTQLCHAIKNVLTTPPAENIVYKIKRIDYFCYIPTQRLLYCDKSVRLYPRQFFQFSTQEVHETVPTQNAKCITLDGFLHHYTNDTVQEFLQKNIRYSNDWGKEKMLQKKRVSLGHCLASSFVSFVRDYIIRGAVFGKTYGFILAVASAHYTLNKYLILYFLNKRAKK